MNQEELPTFLQTNTPTAEAAPRAAEAQARAPDKQKEDKKKTFAIDNEKTRLENVILGGNVDYAAVGINLKWGNSICYIAPLNDLSQVLYEFYDRAEIRCVSLLTNAGCKRGHVNDDASLREDVDVEINNNGKRAAWKPFRIPDYSEFNGNDLIAIGFRQGKVKIYSLLKGRLETILSVTEKHELLNVHMQYWAPFGGLGLITQEKDRVLLWNLEDNGSCYEKILPTQAQGTPLCFATNCCHTLAIASSNSKITIRKTSTKNTLQAATQTVLILAAKNRGTISKIALSPDGTLLAALQTLVGEKVIVYDLVNDGCLIRELAAISNNFYDVDFVQQIRFLPQSDALLVVTKTQYEIHSIPDTGAIKNKGNNNDSNVVDKIEDLPAKHRVSTEFYDILIHVPDTSTIITGKSHELEVKHIPRAPSNLLSLCRRSVRKDIPRLIHEYWLPEIIEDYILYK